MVFFSFLTTLVSIVYPIIGSYCAFNSYSQAADRIAASTFKLGGISVPIGVLFNAKDSASTASDNEQLQIHLISIQKWFIYWIVYATVELAESVLLVRYWLPFYGLAKFAFSVWLVFPMIKTTLKINMSSSFDSTRDWLDYTYSGAGRIFFVYIKPAVDDTLNSVHYNPIKAKFDSLYTFAKSPSVSKFSEIVSESSLTVNSNTNASASTTQSMLQNYSSETLVENSYVIVKSLRNRFYGSEEAAKEVALNEADENDDQAQPDSKVDKTPVQQVEPGTPPKKKSKGWLW